MKFKLLILLSALSLFYVNAENLPEDDPYYPKYCANLNEPVCNDCCENPDDYSKPDKDCVDSNVSSASKDNCDNSFISTLTYSYTHFSTEYTNKTNTEDCSPCSGGSSSSSSVPELTITRLHKFRQMSDRGSFGRGVFMTFDIYFKLYESGGTPRVDMFFAGDRNNRRYFKQGNKFYDTFARSSKELVLYNGNVITTSMANATRAELKSFTGQTYAFEIFAEDSNVKWGRLDYFANELDYRLTFDYEHELTDSVDYEDKFKLSHITDANNRVVAFEYLPGKRMGVNVISKIILPNTSFIEYVYGSAPVTDDTDDYLSQVNYPDGTSSTFVIPEPVNNQTTVEIFEAGEKGTHRNKKVKMTNLFSTLANTARDGQSYFNSASLLVQSVSLGDNNESSFEIYQSPNNANNRRVFEGGNKLKTVNIISARYYKEWEKTGTAGNFDDFTGLTSEESYAHGDWKFYSGNAQGRPPFMNDDHGLKHQYVYNGDNQLVKKIYEDDTFEAWSYNELNYKTRYRDRLGRVTHYEYAVPGKPSLLTSKTVGLIAQPNGSANVEIPGLLARVYDWTGNLLPTNFESMEAVETTSVPNLELNVSDRDERYAMLFTGKIEITNPGDYDFFLSSDDGSKLYIDGVEVIDNDGTHGNTEIATATPLTLTAGKHDIRVEFFERYGQQVLSLSYSGPDSGDVKVQVPDSAYTHLTVEEELEEIDVTTPETATYSYTYYPNTGVPGDNRYLLETETDANGNVTTYTYTSDNQLEYVITPDDAGTGTINKSYFTYDSAKRQATSSDAVGRTTTIDYDSRDRVSKITYSDLSTELFFYGTGGNANLLVKKKDRNGNTTKFEYDTQGRPVTTITAYSVMNDDGSSETVNTPDIQSVEICTYVPGTDLKATCTINGDLTEYFYDYKNRRVETRKHADANSVLTTKTFFKNNLVQWKEDSYGRRTYFSYRIRGAEKSDTAMTRMVQETIPGAINLPNGHYADIDALSRIFSNNAAYLITDFEKDVESQPIATIDPRNILHETDYDSRGRATFSVQAAGTNVEATSQIVYDAQSNVTELRSPRYFSEGVAPEVRTYNARNLLASVTDASGSLYQATSSFTYYDDGREKDYTDFNGNTYTKVWKQCCGRLGVEAGPVYTDKNGNEKRAAKIFQYDYFGNITHTAVLDWDSVTTLPPCCYPDPDDDQTVQETTTKMDQRHRPVAQSSWLDRKDGIELDEPGSIDPNDVPIGSIAGSTSYGLTTQTIYFDEASGHDELQPLLDKLNTAGITFGANTNGAGVIRISPVGEVAVSIQDGVGRTIASGMYDKEDYALGTYTLKTWNITTYDNVVNNLLETKTTSALGFENKVRTDGAGRRIETIDAQNNITSFEYDNNSNLISFRDPNNVGENCLYDERNRDISCTDTKGNTTSRAYDANNNTVTKTDAKNLSENCIFDDRDRLESCTDRINAFTGYSYDGNNNVLTKTDTLGKVTTYEYDSRNLQVQITYPDHISGLSPGDANYGITTCSYDALNRKAVSTDQKGETVHYDFDWTSRLLEREYRFSDKTTESTDSFTYDDASRVLTATKGRYSNTISYTYDEIGRKESETTTVAGNDYTVTHSYDVDNRITNCAYPSGNNIAKVWTSRNQLEKVTFNAADIITSTFDEGMREKTRTFGNNLVSTFTYNADNTRDGISVAGKADLSFSYAYDPNKNVEGESSTGSQMAGYSWTAGFDAEDRVTSWNRNNSDSQNWNLDGIGNWQTTSGSHSGSAFNENRTHNDVHELISINSDGLSYDSKGNITSDKGGNTLVWDIDNHLVSFTKSGSGEITAFTYDAIGRRLEKIASAKSTLFICDGQRVVEEYEDSGSGYSLARSYTYGTYIDDVIAKIEAVSTPTVLYYHCDRQFNVRGLSDTSGAVKELYAYTPYGKQTVISSSITSNNNYGFTGRYIDQETGLWYFRARYFSDDLGRFISRDPLGYVDGMSLYNGYFAQHFLVDPEGKFLLTILVGAAISVGVGMVTRALTGGKALDPTGIIIDATTGLLAAGIVVYGPKIVKAARITLKIRKQKKLKTFYDKIKTPPGVTKPPVANTAFYAERQVQIRQYIVELQGQVWGHCGPLWTGNFAAAFTSVTSNTTRTFEANKGEVKEGLQEEKVIENNTRVIDVIKENKKFEPEACPCEEKD